VGRPEDVARLSTVHSERAVAAFAR